MRRFQPFARFQRFAPVAEFIVGKSARNIDGILREIKFHLPRACPGERRRPGHAPFAVGDPDEGHELSRRHASDTAEPFAAHAVIHPRGLHQEICGGHFFQFRFRAPLAAHAVNIDGIGNIIHAERRERADRKGGQHFERDLAIGIVAVHGITFQKAIAALS